MNTTEIIQKFSKKSLGLTLVLTASAFLYAQEKVAVNGQILDKQNRAVPYASVSFSNQSNKLFSDATLTDENGNYKLSLIPGKYDITIDAIDYKKKTQNLLISNAGKLENLVIEAESSATLTPTKSIEGVVIVAESNKPYKVEIDKKVYDPSQDLISKGGNLQDVLSNVPSVSVDTDGTVSMRGSSNVRFLINGKPSALLGIDDGTNALQSIPADQIEKIEVITNPSSKFEASGTAGILNIILKKNKKVGFNGSVTGTLGYLPHTNLNTNLSWRKGNLSLFLNGGGGYRESKNTNRNNVYYQNVTVDGNNTETHQESITNSNGNSYNATTGFVYDISDKTSVNASGTVRTFENDSDGNVDYQYYYLNSANSVKNRKNIGDSNNLAFQGDFGLDHKFDDKGQNLYLSLSLQRNRTNTDTNVNDTNNGIFSLQDIINQNTINKSIVGKVDYELPIGEKSKIEAGYRLDSNGNDYDNNVQESTSSSPTLNYLGDYTFDAKYKELFNAFYAQFKSKIGNFGYQVGLREEISKVNIDYQNLSGDQINKEKNYNNLFPSVFLSYELGKDNQFLLNYSKRIDRPRSFFMIPNPSYTDNQNIFDGNIDLNPSYVDSYEFGYNISKKKFTLNPMIYYRHQSDDTKMLVYNKLETIDGEEQIVFHTKPINLGTNDTYGLDFNFSFDATSWLKFMGNLDLFGYNTKGSTSYETIDENRDPITAIANFNGKGISTRTRLTSSFKIDKTFNFQIQGFYRGGTKTEYQERKNMYAINFGASKTLLKGNGTLTFNIQDIFNTRAMQATTYSANSVRESYMQWMPRQFSLSLTYRFKQGEKVEQPKKKKDINNNATGGDDQAPM